MGPSLRRLVVMIFMLALASCAPRPAGIYGSGTIELDEIDVASMVGGRVVVLAVDEGDAVNAGDTLAVLDRGELTADVDAQSAQSERAAAQLRDLRAGPRAAEIGTARAEVAAASSQATLTAAELARVKALSQQGLASGQELDRAQSASDAAAARRDAATQQLRLVEAGYRRDQISAAAAAASAARAQLAAARTRAGELVLLAPARGIVLLRNFEPGEIAMAGVPVVTLGNPDSLWIRAYIAAPSLPRVRLGAIAEITVDGVKQAFRGRVVEIAIEAEFTPRAALTEEERANLMFPVRIVIDPTGGALKAGLPADVRILETAP